MVQLIKMFIQKLSNISKLRIQTVIKSMRRQSSIQENGGLYTHSMADQKGRILGVLDMKEKNKTKTNNL